MRICGLVVMIMTRTRRAMIAISRVAIMKLMMMMTRRIMVPIIFF